MFDFSNQSFRVIYPHSKSPFKILKKVNTHDLGILVKGMPATIVMFTN